MVANEVRQLAQRSAKSASAINAAMTTLDRGMQQNAAMAEQTSAASVELLRSANDLTGQVARFQRDDDARPAAPMVSAAA
ncbi:MAG: hypothetical protein EDM03_10175 [Porphyrobacter sp. IPPAS B-1204]|nr:MAG: hypothetical protein EDM03_10175 [Porphyrobacter sp. IPPAS B-1204]